MTITHWTTRRLTAALLFGCAASAHAGLTGSTVTLRYDYDAQPSTTDSFAVGAGAELNCTGGGSGNANVCVFLNAAGSMQTVDVGDSTLSYFYAGPVNSFSATQPNSFNFLGLDAFGPIGSVALATNIVGLDLSRVTFTANSVSVDVSALPLNDQQGFALALLPVPEPASGALMLAGAAVVASSVRRRRR